jgi:hypothetical protein
MEATMNRRDQELLDKQFRWLRPEPRHEGVMIVALVAVFLAGIAVGGRVVAYDNAATHIASTTAADAAAPQS